MAQFTPPQFIPPQVTTPSGSGSENPNQPRQSPNLPGSLESSGEVAKSVAKSHVIKTTTALVINTREEFARYLAQSDLDLVTSWVEFENSRNFVTSSYVVYTKFNSAIEPLTDFLQRYPQLLEPVNQLNTKLQSV
jgi:hypothetical protein